MEAGGDAGEVDRADDELRPRQGGLWQREAAFSDAQLAADEGRGQQVSGEQSRKETAERQTAAMRQAEQGAGGLGTEEEGRGAQSGETDADRHAAEEHHPGDIRHAEAVLGIESVADGAAAQKRDPEAVADRQAGEGGEGGVPIGKRMPGIAQGAIIEEGEARIAGGGPEEGSCPCAGGQRKERAPQLGRVVAGQIAPEQKGRQQEQR